MARFLFLLFFFGSSLLLAQSIQIDEAKATISFHFLDDDVNGSMGDFNFTGNVDLGDLSNSVFSGSVVTKTLDTNNWLRSRHLRARKFFNASEFPKLKFNSSSVSGSSKEFRVTGELEIKGIARTLVWRFKNSDGILTGTAKLNTQDYDISIHERKDRNDVEVTITLPYKQFP